jgi:hypothetical protein
VCVFGSHEDWKRSSEMRTAHELRRLNINSIFGTLTGYEQKGRSQGGEPTFGGGRDRLDSAS